MIDRRRLLAGASLTWLAAGCGGPRPVATEGEAEIAGQPVRMLLRVDVEAARAAGDISPSDPTADVTRQVLTILERRLSLLGRRARVELTSDGPELLAVRLLEEIAPTDLARLIDELEARGRLGLYIQARHDELFGQSGGDLASEAEKLDAWCAANPALPLTAFNEVPTSKGGPVRATEEHAGLKWGVAKPDDSNGLDPRTERERAVPLLVQPDEAWRFHTEDLQQVYLSQGATGHPEVGFELNDHRKADFGVFTEAHIDRLMVIEMDGTCVSIATINEKLPGQGIIMGFDSAPMVEAQIATLRAGELPAPVRVVEIR